MNVETRIKTERTGKINPGTRINATGAGRIADRA
jgi:hypothetical protein